MARSFADWGIPTSDAILYAREAAPELAVFASGGLRDGIDVAKCIALGASLGGMAGPLLKAAAQSTDAVLETLREINAQLRISMLCTGAANLEALRQTPLHRASS